MPLESYFTSLMPIIPSSVSAGGSLPDAEHLIRCFDKAEFLKRINTGSSSSPLLDGRRNKRVEMYRRFLNSRTFDLWHYEKMIRVKEHLARKK